MIQQQQAMQEWAAANPWYTHIPVPLQQGQTAYPGQPFHGPPGYPGQSFPQGQNAVPSNNLPNAIM